MLVGDKGRFVADGVVVSFLVVGIDLIFSGEATVSGAFRVTLLVGTGAVTAKAADRAVVLVDLEPREEASLQRARRGEQCPR